MVFPAVEVDGEWWSAGGIDSGGVEVRASAVIDEVDLLTQLPVGPVGEPEVEAGQRGVVGIGFRRHACGPIRR